jgi:hypothetical protein
MCQGQRAEAVDLRRHADREIVNPQTFRQRELMRKEKKRKEKRRDSYVRVTMCDRDARFLSATMGWQASPFVTPLTL